MFLSHFHRPALWAMVLLALAAASQLVAVQGADQTFIGVWSPAHYTKDIVDPSLVSGTSLAINIDATNLPPITNSTDGGINAFEVYVRYNPLILNATDADYKTPLCPAAEGCLFDKPQALLLKKNLNSTTGTVRLAVSLLGPVVDGSGTLFRIRFTVVGNGFTTIAVGQDSSLLGPVGTGCFPVCTVLPYQTIDGSFDNRENIPPVAHFTTTPQSPTTNQQVSFDASQSYDPDGSITSYEWSFGDGGSTTGVQVTHSFASPGDYTVTLTVTDDVGATGLDTQTLTVSAAPDTSPVAVFTFTPASPTIAEQVTFEGSQSYDPDGSVALYNWDFGDGNTATGSQTTHSFESAGNYTVRLTVTDNQGASAAETQTLTVTIGTEGSNTGPTPTFPTSIVAVALAAAAAAIIIGIIVFRRRPGRK